MDHIRTNPQLTEGLISDVNQLTSLFQDFSRQNKLSVPILPELKFAPISIPKLEQQIQALDAQLTNKAQELVQETKEHVDDNETKNAQIRQLQERTAQLESKVQEQNTLLLTFTSTSDEKLAQCQRDFESYSNRVESEKRQITEATQRSI